MTWLWACALLASQAAAAPPAGTPALLVLEPGAPEALAHARADVRDLVATAFTERLLDEVVTAATVKARLDLEAQKQELGCDDVSCAAEIAQALGARFVVVTRLSVLGSQHILNIELLEAAGVRVLGRGTAQAADLDGIVARVGPLVDVVIAQAGDALQRRAARVDIIVDEPGGLPAATTAGVIAVAGAGVAAAALVAAFGVGAGRAGADDVLDAAVGSYAGDPDEDARRAVVDARRDLTGWQGAEGIAGATAALLVPAGLITAAVAGIAAAVFAATDGPEAP